MSTFIARTAVADSPKRSRLAIAIFSALALVMALLTPAMPANATGSGSITAVTTSSTGTLANTTVTITGTDFKSGSTNLVTGVKFGSTAAASFTVNSATSITATPPTSGSGTVNITLEKADGSVTINSAFTFRSTYLPLVSSVSPTSGSATGYTSVTINGSNFTGTTAVRFGTTNAVAFSILSDSRIVAVAPEGTAGATVRVYVQNAAGTTTSVANYKYKTSTCVAGTYLTTKFGYLSSTLTKKQKRDIREAADDFVSLGCEQVSLVKYIGKRKGSSSTYKAYLTLQNKRADAVSTVLEKRLATWGIPIFVTEVKRANQKSQAKKTTPDALVSYRNVLLRVPSSNGIEVAYPNSGPTTGGGTVVITGKGFFNVAETGAVKFGSTASPSYTVNATGTKITATVPAGIAGNTNITVQTGVAGTSTAKLYSKAYSYVSAPTITSLTTNTSGSIVGGTTVTITGTNFTGVTAVRFGSVNATSFTVNSATSITAVSPAGTVGSVVATVVAAGGSVSGGTFTYTSAPSISSMAWASSGSTLTITGTHLSGASLTVAGSTPSVSNSSTATSLIATNVTEPSTTSRLVTVTTSLGVATKGIVDPAVTSVTWSTAAGGTLTITGTGLAGADEVTVGGASIGMSSGLTVSQTQIVKTGYTPPASSATLLVRTPLGTSVGVSFLAPPSPPAAPTAVAGSLSATISVTAGSGAAPVTYLVSVVGDATKNCTVTAPATSCTISGLLSSSSYTFSATATNASGTSAASAASNSVTPDPAP